MDTILRGSLVPIRGWDKEWFNYLESSQTESQTLKDQMLIKSELSLRAWIITYLLDHREALEKVSHSISPNEGIKLELM